MIEPTCEITETFLREAEPAFVVGEILEAFDDGVRTITIRPGGGNVGIMTHIPGEQP